MFLKTLRAVVTPACILSLTFGSPTVSNSPDGEGERIDPVGIITSLDDDGIFTIEGSDYGFRLFEIEFAENFPKAEFVGQNVGCRSVYSKEQISEYGLPEDVIVVFCQFESLFLRGDVADALVNTTFARRVCDEQGTYFVECPYKEN